MGMLIQIVGNLGVGKTTLATQLAERLPATPFWESPVSRPFQAEFAADKQRWALANQIDFFLFRAEQERAGRGIPGVALYDGGLDQDFWVFSQLIAKAGYLTAAEHALCVRAYQALRVRLPSPELTIIMDAPLDALHSRRAQRARQNDGAIIEAHFLSQFQELLESWVDSIEPASAIHFDASNDAFWDQQAVDALCVNIRKRLTLASPE